MEFIDRTDREPILEVGDFLKFEKPCGTEFVGQLMELGNEVHLFNNQTGERIATGTNGIEVVNQLKKEFAVIGVKIISNKRAKLIFE